MTLFAKRKFHLVFLIDVNLGSYADCSHCEEVIFIVNRILAAIRERGRHEHSSKKQNNTGESDRSTSRSRSSHDREETCFKWGYKLFSSFSTLPRDKNDHACFQNLNRGQIRMFEAKLYEVSKSVTTESEKPSNIEKCRKSISHPSQLFATALTEILHDFSWSSPNGHDYGDNAASPVTRGKENIELKMDHNASLWCNLVFLVSRAPLTDKALRQFACKKIVDSDVFIDSFMTPALLAEYQNNCIALNWIDMNSASCAQRLQIDSFDKCARILHETCSKLGGKFLSKKSFISNLPLLHLDEEQKRLHCTSEKNHSKFHNVSSESYILDLLFRGAGDFLNFQEKCISAKLSIDCLGVRNVPLQLKSVAKMAFQGGTSQEKYVQLTFEETSEPSLHFLGMVHDSDIFEKLPKHSSVTFMLTCTGSSGPFAQFLQTLEVLDTLALFSVVSNKKRRDVLAVLHYTPSGCFLSFLYTGSLKCPHLNIYTERKEKECLAHALFSESQTVKGKVLNNPYVNKEGLTKKYKRDHTRSYKLHQIYRSQCLDSWHLPGSTRISPLSDSLQDRINEKQRVSKNNKNGLKKLKRFYTKERQPKELIYNDNPLPSISLCATKRVEQSYSAEPEHKGPLAHGTSSSPSALPRGRLMVNRARSASLLSAEDTSRSSLSKTPEQKPFTLMSLSEMGIKSEDDLQKHLKNQYEQILKSNFVSKVAVNSMVAIAIQFMATMEYSDSVRAAASFMQDHLLLTPTDLKEKYQGDLTSDDVARKANEFRLQVILILEIESASMNFSSVLSDTLTNKLVAMLRALSFSTGPTDLKEFLMEIVASYGTALPKMMVDIHDELMMPLPMSLRKFSSPSGPSSVLTGCHSLDLDGSFSSAPGSSQPSSFLSDGDSQQAKSFSRFKQHPSFTNFDQKKQILVEPVSKPKPKRKVKITTTEQPRVKAAFSRKRQRGECDKAKRNLFSDHKSKAKTSRARTKYGKAARKRRHALCASEKAQTLVMGTPVHKQKSGWHIQQQERRRFGGNVESVVQVVAESPMKETETESEKINKPAKFLVREAFYSSSSQQSRNFARAVEQSQKSDGFPISEILYEKYPDTSRPTQGTLASAVRGESPMISPRSRLRKTFMTSPTPASQSKWQERTTPVRTPGRQSKRLAKKLDFSNTKRKTLPSFNQPPTLDAQLIFDGENAIDFNIIESPSKRLSTEAYHKSLKTPEKQIKPSLPDMWTSASCPPSSSTYHVDPGQKLSFRNVLFENAKSNELGTHARMSSINQRISTRNKPDNQSPQRLTLSSTLSSPDQASHLRSNLFCKSPKKMSSATDCLEKDKINSVFNKGSWPEKGYDVSKRSTPAKNRGEKPLQVEGVTHGASTPSKVKFSDTCLIAPPTDINHPPSTEKLTPHKSILKGSPNFKTLKVPRRIQLQPVHNAVLRRDTHVTNDSEDVFAASQSKTFISSQEDVQSFVGSTSFSDQFTLESMESINRVKPEAGMSENASEKLLCTKSQSGKIKKMKAEIAGTSSYFNSVEKCDRGKNRPATIQIRTPSPEAKRDPVSIQNWARRKKCSPKQSSNSAFNTSLSPKDHSNNGKNLEDINDTNITDMTKFMNKSSKKRGLFQCEVSEMETTSKKRLQKNSTLKHLGCDKPNQFNIATIPVLSEALVTECHPTDTDSNNVHLPSAKASFSQNLLPLSSEKSEPALYQSASFPKRLTRQCSNILEERSLGFPSPTSSSSRNSPPTIDKDSDVWCQMELSGNTDLTDSSCLKPCAAATNNSGIRSPDKAMPSTSTTPKKKQYSPSLSTLGLIHLIRSPIVRTHSTKSDRQEKEIISNVKSKSRKHLDLT